MTITGTGTIILAANNLNGFANDNSSDGAQGNVTFNVPITGPTTGGICAEEASGNQYLNAANTYAGGTYLGYSGSSFRSIWNFNNNNAFGTGPIHFLNCGNTGIGALVAEGTSPLTIPNPWAVYQTTPCQLHIVPPSPAGLTFSGNWQLTGGLGTAGAPGYETSGAALATYAEMNLLIGNVAGDLVTISGVISGTNGFTKAQNGTLALSGKNTLTGQGALHGITISNGTLTITGSGDLGDVSGTGSYAGNITNGITGSGGPGAFIYNSTAGQTLSGVISGSNTFTCSAGTLTLSGANTYTNTNTLNGGILNLALGKRRERAGLWASRLQAILGTSSSPVAPSNTPP